MSLPKNHSSNTYQRRGYKVTHYIQRCDGGYKHTFILHDQLGMYVPTISRLIKMFIQPLVAECYQMKVLAINCNILDVHHVQYEVLIRCDRTKEATNGTCK